MMNEIKDLEKEHAHYDIYMAKETFKMIVFKWRILNKVQKMKLLDRESYEFTKASIEIEEMLKTDVDSKIRIAIADLKGRYEEVKQEKF